MSNLFARMNSQFYRFVGNDPVNNLDPMGLISLKKLGAKTIVAGRALGRWVPLLGWAQLAYDVYKIGECATDDDNDLDEKSSCSGN